MSFGGGDDRKRRNSGSELVSSKRFRTIPSASDVYDLTNRRVWDDVKEALDMGAEPDKPGSSGVLSALRRVAPVLVIEAFVKAGSRLTYPEHVSLPYGGQARYTERYPVFYSDPEHVLDPISHYSMGDKFKILRMLLKAGAPVTWGDGDVQSELVRGIVSQDPEQWKGDPASVVKLVALLNRYGAEIKDYHVRTALVHPSRYEQYLRAKDLEQPYVPVLVGLRKGAQEKDGALKNFNRHPLYTRDVLRALMRLSV